MYSRDPEYNILTGSKYFADTLAGQGGNVALALGMYNGWYPGLSTSQFSYWFTLFIIDVLG